MAEVNCCSVSYWEPEPIISNPINRIERINRVLIFFSMHNVDDEL